MQHEKRRIRAGCNGVRSALIVAELDQAILLAQALDNRTDLSARKTFRRKIGEQRHHVEHVGSFRHLLDIKRGLSAAPFQHSDDAEVLVEVGPMNAHRHKFEIGPLLR